MNLEYLPKESLNVTELRAKLQEDPYYAARLVGDEATIKWMQQAFEEYMFAAAPLFTELAEAGFYLNRLSDLFTIQDYANKPAYQRAVPILLRWLPRISDLRVKESIVRTLSVKWARPLATPILIQEFRQDKDPDSLYKWAVGNALSVVADNSVFDDIVDLAQNKQHGKAREMVVVALGNMKDPRAVDVLIELLKDEQVNGHVLFALKKLKDPKSRQYIEPFINHPKTLVRNEAKKALAKLDKAR